MISIRRMIPADHRAIMAAPRLAFISRSVRIMSRDVPDDGHRHDIQKSDDPDQVEDQSSPFILWRPVHEWHDEEEQRDEVEGQDPKHFAIEFPNLCRKQL